jgi:hypothetical protein
VAGVSGRAEDQDDEARQDRMWLGPVIGLACLAALAVVYYIVAHPRQKSQAAVPYLLGVTTSQIHALEFQVHGKTLTLYQNAVPGGSGATLWTIGSPGGQQADQPYVQGFVSSLVTLQPTRTVTKSPTSADLQSFGLAPPGSVMTIERTGSAAPIVLDVGVPSPVGDYYAQVGGSPTVYLIGSTIGSEITANTSAWLPPPSSTSASGASASGASGFGAGASSASASTPGTTAPKGSGASASASASSS